MCHVRVPGAIGAPVAQQHAVVLDKRSRRDSMTRWRDRGHHHIISAASIAWYAWPFDDRSLTGRSCRSEAGDCAVATDAGDPERCVGYLVTRVLGRSPLDHEMRQREVGGGGVDYEDLDDRSQHSRSVGRWLRL